MLMIISGLICICISFGAGYILGFGDGNFERDKYRVDNGG